MTNASRTSSKSATKNRTKNPTKSETTSAESVNELGGTGTIDWHQLIAELSRPFPAHVVSWRAGAVSRDKKRAQALPYVDPRAYEDRLNEVVPGHWSVLFRPWGESRLICELTIHGVTRSSTGEFLESDRIAQGTAAEAQAFKRACSKFGLGRYLYDIPIVWVDYDDDRGRLLETPELGGRFVPAEGASGNDDAPLDEDEATLAGGGAGDPLGTLDRERADAMARELEKLGIARRDQGKFVSAVLGRSVRALTQLTDAEAVEVWNVAKRSHHDIAV